MNCAKCGASQGEPHVKTCIHALGFSRVAPPIVQPGQCVKPMNTSELGPIKVDPNSDAAKAKVMREALLACMAEPSNTFPVNVAFKQLAHTASDTTLLKLRRLIR